jgi:hypothetical protein
MYDRDIPGKLDNSELELILRILPDDKPGYRIYRKKISDYYLTGKGSTDSSIILSKDLQSEVAGFITPVFATGIYLKENNVIDVTIHEETDDTIEIEILKEKALPGKVYKSIIYPEWVPGMGAPGDNSPVREVVVQDDKLLLGISTVQKKIWIYEYATGVNHFISTGPFYSNLCFVRKIRDAKIVFDTKLLFLELDKYSDYELISAFYLYNKSLNKFRIEMPSEPALVKAPGLLRRIFKKDKY